MNEQELRTRYKELLAAYRAKNRELKKLKRRKKVEFAKVILGVYAFACISWIQQDYVLAFLEKREVNAGVTVAIIGTLAAAIIAYYAKSIGEKHSRNINHVDENGKPYDCGKDEQE